MAQAKLTKELVNLPNGMTCYKEFEQEALKIYWDAYDRAFDGENYEYANVKADIALEKFFKD
jgi:hypothetical protein